MSDCDSNREVLEKLSLPGPQNHPLVDPRSGTLGARSGWRSAFLRHMPWGAERVPETYALGGGACSQNASLPPPLMMPIWVEAGRLNLFLYTLIYFLSTLIEFLYTIINFLYIAMEILYTISEFLYTSIEFSYTAIAFLYTIIEFLYMISVLYIPSLIFNTRSLIPGVGLWVVPFTFAVAELLGTKTWFLHETPVHQLAVPCAVSAVGDICVAGDIGVAGSASDVPLLRKQSL